VYDVKILADSVNLSGDRLTTFELTYPRMVHAELMTHRLFSRNSASSRAIPTTKLIQRVLEHPVEPKWWGKNQSGMQARAELEGDDLVQVQHMWLQARDTAVRWANALREAGLHKQIANRLIEPWMFITVIVSATEFDNWFHLRDDPDAQPEIAWVAREMRKLYDSASPEQKDVGDWHLPLVNTTDPTHKLYVDPAEPEIKGDPLGLAKISIARCARVSYLTHDGERDLCEDLKLHDRLAESGHWSPFEHAAEADEGSARYGNFFGWRQYRKLFKREHVGRSMQ
jgi:thymidylate synthase ThyX